MHCFSFDIETVPDVEFGARFWDLADLPDEDVATAMMFKRQQQTGSDFLPPAPATYRCNLGNVSYGRYVQGLDTG